MSRKVGLFELLDLFNSESKKKSLGIELIIPHVLLKEDYLSSLKYTYLSKKERDILPDSDEIISSDPNLLWNESAVNKLNPNINLQSEINLSDSYDMSDYNKNLLEYRTGGSGLEIPAVIDEDCHILDLFLSCMAYGAICLDMCYVINREDMVSLKPLSENVINAMNKEIEIFVSENKQNIINEHIDDLIKLMNSNWLIGLASFVSNSKSIEKISMHVINLSKIFNKTIKLSERYSTFGGSITSNLRSKKKSKRKLVRKKSEKINKKTTKK